MSEELRYPIGRFRAPAGATAAQRAGWVDAIEAAPAGLHAAVTGLTPQQLDTPYRPGGWTVRQVVHHVPDSHMNAYIRTCLALTEDNPTVRPYNEAEWAKIPFSQTGPIEISLTLLDAVHARWLPILRALSAADFERPLYHPDNGPMRLESLIAMYAWHGAHHTAHITRLRERERW